MKSTVSFGSLLIVILLATSLFASGVGLTGMGARATALGGNFRGVADDWSAMYWNPAGITQINSMQFGGALEVIMPTASYLPAEYLHPVLTANNPQKFSGLYYKKLVEGKHEVAENEPRTFFMPSLGFVYGMGNMSLGLGVFVPFGLGAKWDLLNTANYNPNYRQYDFEDDLQVLDFHPTFSYKVNEKLSVGAGFGLIMAKIKIIKPNFTKNPVMGLLSLAQALPDINPALTPTAQYINEQLGGTFAAENFVAPYDHLITEVNLEGDGTGFGFNLGVKYDLTEQLSVGVSGRYYLDVDIEGTLKKDTYFVHNKASAYMTVAAVLDTIHKYVPQQVLDVAGINAEAEAAMRGMYSGGLNPADPAGISKFTDDNAKAKLPLPMEVGLGLAYKATANLLLSTDVSWTQWSTWDIIEIELSDGSKNELVEKWDDGIRVGIGMEYTKNVFQFRAGYYTEPSAVPDLSLTPTIPDISRRHAVNFGLSYHLGKIAVHGSYEHIFLSERKIGTTGWVYNDAAMGYDNMAGEYNMNVNNLMFGIQYDF